jgi:hypothetical protein
MANDTDKTTPAEWPSYRFRWSNVDLEAFKNQRRFAADKLRREAEILMKRADQIDQEMHEWACAMEPASDE